MLVRRHDPVIGNIAAHPCFQDWMAAFDHFDAVIFMKFGFHIALSAGKLRHADQHINLGQGMGARMQIEQAFFYFLEQLRKKSCLQLYFVFLGMQDLFLLLLEFLGNISCRIGECLFGHIAEFRTDMVKIAVAHFDIVSKYPVVSDLQRLDLRALSFLLFKL